MIRVADDGHPLAIEVLVPVRDAVHQLAAFKVKGIGNIHPGHAPQGVHESVGAVQPHR